MCSRLNGWRWSRLAIDRRKHVENMAFDVGGHDVIHARLGCWIGLVALLKTFGVHARDMGTCPFGTENDAAAVHVNLLRRGWSEERNYLLLHGEPQMHAEAIAGHNDFRRGNPVHVGL